MDVRVRVGMRGAAGLLAVQFGLDGVQRTFAMFVAFFVALDLVEVGPGEGLELGFEFSIVRWR
jgi:hypothetical protein